MKSPLKGHKQELATAERACDETNARRDEAQTKSGSLLEGAVTRDNLYYIVEVAIIPNPATVTAPNVRLMTC